jgi:RNA polymerase subunit RPABC4/transcription elongation factor Spt4
MINKRCPKCERVYSELDNYCRKCGIVLEKDLNRCSGNKTTRCEHLTFDDDDVYCPACGSLTTYAVGKDKENEAAD